MEISNEDGVSITVTTRLPLSDEPRQTHIKARPRQWGRGRGEAETVFFWGRGKPMKYRASWHEAGASKFSASRQPQDETSASRTTSLVFSVLQTYVLERLFWSGDNSNSAYRRRRRSSDTCHRLSTLLYRRHRHRLPQYAYSLSLLSQDSDTNFQSQSSVARPLTLTEFK